MRLRNNLLALCILILFLGFGVLYVRFWVVQRPSGIIIFVSDGLVAKHLTAARLFADGAGYRLEIERNFSNAALVRTDAVQFAVPDAASMSSAIATGRMARHHTAGVDERGNPVASILELAREEGRAVGLITNGSLTSASSAAFYAHSSSAEDGSVLAKTLLSAPRFQVLLGGGAEDFLPAGKGGRRKDGRDLLGELQAPGWEVVRGRAELENAAQSRAGRKGSFFGLAPNDPTLFGLFADDVFDFSKKREVAVTQPSLADLTRCAIKCLQNNRRGYVLVVDEALISQACVANEGEHLLRETVELDRAFGVAVRDAGEKSLIIGVGRTSIGGFALSGYPLRQDRGLALLGPTPEGHPYITWATGPSSPQSSEPAARETPGGVNTAEDVIAVARGLGADRVRGFLDSTDIFKIVRDAL